MLPLPGRAEFKELHLCWTVRWSCCTVFKIKRSVRQSHCQYSNSGSANPRSQVAMTPNVLSERLVCSRAINFTIFLLCFSWKLLYSSIPQNFSSSSSNKLNTRSSFSYHLWSSVSCLLVGFSLSSMGGSLACVLIRRWKVVHVTMKTA